MANFDASIAADIAATCQTGAAEASQALSRALDSSLMLTFESTGTWGNDVPTDLKSGPGLALLLHTDEGSAVFLIPEASGILPGWYGTPDATGISKLLTLAQELGMLLLPEANMPLDFASGKIRDISTALARGGVDPATGVATLSLVADGTAAQAYLLWPVANANAVLAEPAPPGAVPAASPLPSAPTRGRMSLPSGLDMEEAIPQLPAYTRSLLRIKVTLAVTLATSKQPIHRIIDLGPGSILQFEKPCDQPLTLRVGDHEIASGEAVKVGEKFGLRVTEMILPGERFLAVRGTRHSA
jgi:flagellar motor switch protein FliN/FliY